MKTETTAEETMLLRALEKLCASVPEKFDQRLTLRLGDDFVIAWLGQRQHGLPRHVLVETKICSFGATVGETISQLRTRLKLAA